MTEKNMIQLTLTEEQARIVAKACEFYARMRIGQFYEVTWNFLDVQSADEYCRRREEAERLLLEVRKQIYPDLTGAGHSYGIGKFEDADKSFDVYQVIRYAMGGSYPFSYHDLPKCIKLVDGE